MTEENFMDEKLTPLTPVVTPSEERRYVIPPHPEAAAPLSVETTAPAEPIAAEESVADMIQVAVAELRSEITAEIKFEVQKERLKEVTFDAKN
jgi:hypothetical protein